MSKLDEMIALRDKLKSLKNRLDGIEPIYREAAHEWNIVHDMPNVRESYWEFCRRVYEHWENEVYSIRSQINSLLMNQSFTKDLGSYGVNAAIEDLNNQITCEKQREREAKEQAARKIALNSTGSEAPYMIAYVPFVINGLNYEYKPGHGIDIDTLMGKVRYTVKACVHYCGRNYAVIQMPIFPIRFVIYQENGQFLSENINKTNTILNFCAQKGVLN